MEVTANQEGPVLSYCTSCWKNRIITTNGKCRVCGTDILKRHWKITIKKLDILISITNVTPIEIKGKMYLIPDKMLDKYRELDNYSEKIKFIEYVKTSCKNYKM